MMEGIKESWCAEERPKYPAYFLQMIAQFLCIATANEGSKVIKVLEDYEKDSGQKLNKEKNSAKAQSGRFKKK